MNSIFLYRHIYTYTCSSCGIDSSSDESIVGAASGASVKFRDHVKFQWQRADERWGLITVEARGLTFQRDRRYTRLAHLRDFELWPETVEVKRWRLGLERWKEGVSKRELMWVTCNVLLVREAALIISYPKLNFPSFVPAWILLPPPLSFAITSLFTSYETISGKESR